METYEVSQQFQHHSSMSYQYVDQVEENAWIHGSDEESLHILKELLREVDYKGHKMCKKLVSRVEKDVEIGRVIRKRVHDLCGKSGTAMLEKIVRKLDKECDDISRDRGAYGDILEETKLDRFKVKTLNTIGVGVVKEEGK